MSAFEYASDDSDGDKKPSNKNSITFSYVEKRKHRTRTIPIDDLTNVETRNPPFWDFEFKYSPEGPHFYVGVKTLIGEAHCIRAKGSDTTSDIRKLYCETHPEWDGYVHPAINFIDSHTDYFLPDDRPLDKLGVKHGSILLLVVGDDKRHTGGGDYNFQGPPTRPHDNMYQFTAPITAPPVAAAAAAAPAPSEEMAADSNDPPPTSNETTTTLVRSCIIVHHVVNTPGGTTTQFQTPPPPRSNRGKAHFITNKKGLGVTYIMGVILPSGHLKKIDIAEEQLRGRDPSSIDPIYVSFRINDRKIGSADDLDHAMEKLIRFRTQHPGALISGVFILHENNHREVEKALHVRYTLLRGGSYGEHFSHLTQWDQYQILDMAERFDGGAFVYFSTKSFPQCHFEDIDFKGEGDGVVYAVRPRWSKHEKEILSACIEAHGSDEDCWTLQHGLQQGSCGRLCDIYSNGIKVGQHNKEADLGNYFSSGILWANGCTQGVEYRFVKTSKRKKRERQAHRKLDYLDLHIAGEYFFPASGDVTLSSWLDALFNGGSFSTYTRALEDMHEPLWRLQEWLELGYISHKIIWECVKRGAIMLCTDDDDGGRSWNSVTEAQMFLSANPNLGKDGFTEKLKSFLKTRCFEAGVDALRIGTMIGKDVKLAKESKHVTIKTATCEFRAPASLEDAKREFIAIFSEDIYNAVTADALGV